MIYEFRSFGISVQVHDPLADAGPAMREYGITLLKEHELAPSDAVVLAISHDSYRAAGWPLIERLLKNGRGLVMDDKRTFDPQKQPAHVDIWRL